MSNNLDVKETDLNEIHIRRQRTLRCKTDSFPHSQTKTTSSFPQQLHQQCIYRPDKYIVG